MMTDEILSLWDLAEESETTGVSAKEREFAFDHFIDRYHTLSVDVQNEFRDRLPFAYNSRGLAR